MKIYKAQNVFNAAIDRIRYLFEEFPEVIVGLSGGKDSTVTFNLALMVAREKNRLPLKVMFLDQEAEWEGTIDTVREVMYKKEVEPLWFQIPMTMTNNASSFNRYNYCWNPEDEKDWIHPRDPIAQTENRYKTNRFHDLFGAILKVDFAGKKVCYLAGVRTEETPKRLMALTGKCTYKHISYAKELSKKEEHYTFYPIYDWSHSDVWKAIGENNWNYNRIYDEMYKKGVPIQDMRISNLHHETAVQVLILVQEIEPKTWEKVSKRIDGANTIKHLKLGAISCPRDLPPMFESWKDYGTYLIGAMVQEEKNRQRLLKVIERWKAYMINEATERSFFRTIISTILTSDWDLTKITNFVVRQEFQTVKNLVNGTITADNYETNKKNNRLVQI